MTVLVTRFGDKIDTKQFESKGFGVFTKYVQENYDKLFGKQTTDHTKFNVTLSAIKEIKVYTDVTVEAESMKEAEQKALETVKKDKYGFDWKDYCNCDEFISDLDIDNCEELEEEE